MIKIERNALWLIKREILFLNLLCIDDYAR